MKAKIFKAPQEGQLKRPVTINSDKFKNGDRFIIRDAVTGAVVDNAKGFGFKTHKPTANIKYMNINQIERAMYKDIVNQLVKIADEESRTNSMNLKPGTYTALEIHRCLEKQNKYYLTGHYASRDEQPILVTADTMTVKLCRHEIFYYISKFEKAARLSGKKAHRWTFDDGREVAATATVTFPCEKAMKKLPGIVKETRKTVIIFSLIDGCLRNINYWGYDNVSKPVFSIKIGEGYTPMTEYQDMSFLIDSKQLKHLYGECKIRLYKGRGCNLASLSNPLNMRLIIENADGWCVSADVVMPISPTYLKLYDSDSAETTSVILSKETSTSDSIVTDNKTPCDDYCVSEVALNADVIPHSDDVSIQQTNLSTEINENSSFTQPPITATKHDHYPTNHHHVPYRFRNRHYKKLSKKRLEFRRLRGKKTNGPTIKPTTDITALTDDANSLNRESSNALCANHTTSIISAQRYYDFEASSPVRQQSAFDSISRDAAECQIQQTGIVSKIETKTVFVHSQPAL